MTASEPIPRVAIFGAGALGGYFGARLAQAGAAEVHLIGRGSHLEAIRERGLLIRSLSGEFRVQLPATSDPAEIGLVDFVFFTVKSYDTENAARLLGPLLGPETAVVSFQNGIDNEEKLAATIGPEHVMGGAAFVFAAVAEPGVVDHTGGPGRLVFGELHGGPGDRDERLLAACRRAEIPAELSTQIRTELWSKYAFILAQAGMTAAIRLPIGEIRSAPAAWEMFRTIVEEACRVGRAEGISLPEDLVERHLAFAQGLDASGYSSLYHDLVTGHRMELAALHAALVGRAEQHRIPVPACRATYAILEPWALRNEKADPEAFGKAEASESEHGLG